MKRLVLIAIVLSAVGLGCGKKPPPFNLTIDTVTVDGTVSDTFDSDPEMALNGTPLTVTAGAFSAACDTSAQSSHTITATDDVNNVTTVTVQVQ